MNNIFITSINNDTFNFEFSTLDSINFNLFRAILVNNNIDLGTNIEKINLKKYQFKLVAPSLLNWVKKNRINLNYDENTYKSLKAIQFEIRNFKKIEKLNLITDIYDIQKILDKNNFNRKLTKFQNRDVFKLINLLNSANFSVPGAGKTTVCLAQYSILKKLNVIEKMLVISPVNAFISWKEEVSTIYNDISLTILDSSQVQEYDSSMKMYNIFVVNYEKLRNNIIGLELLLTKYKFFVVLDESHRIKSGFLNKSYNNIMSLGALASKKEIMSGTPMPQSRNDIISQFTFLWSSSSKIVENLLETSNDLNNDLNYYFVRTTKKELGLKKPKLIYTEIEMGPLQKKIIELLRYESRRKLENLDKDKLHALRFMGKSVIRLIQASTNPSLLTSSEDVFDKDDGIRDDSDIWNLIEDYIDYEFPVKFKVLLEKVKKSVEKNEKVLIWSIFVKNILYLKEYLKDYNPAIIYGDVKSFNENDINSRQGQISKFHKDDSCMVMIANPQACGEGISLHKICNYAIYLERNFNAAHYLQSMDRIHRFGLDKNVETKIEILISKNSLDNRIDERLRSKISNLDNLLNDSTLKELAYDPYDIEDQNISGIDSEDYSTIKEYLNNGKT